MELTTTDIGSRIRQAREQRGLTLRDIANATKISTTALNAIERNDFDRLPGGVFRRACVRAFAAEVGLNADEFASEYRTRFEAESLPGRHRLNEADADQRARTHRRAAAASVSVVGLLLGSWLISRPAHINEGLPPEEWTVNVGEANLPEHNRTPIDGADLIDEVAVADAAVEAVGEPSLRLDIRTNGPCWIFAVADGERVLYRLMQPGERTLIEAHGAITFRVGDAGTVVYSINGATGRPLGRNGEVVTVRVTKDNLGSLFAEPASAIPRKGAATQIGSGSGGAAEGRDLNA